MKPLWNRLKIPAALALTAVALVAFLYFWAWLFRPEFEAALPEYDEEKVAEAEALRNFRFDTSKPLVLVQEVDYGEGEDASWWPRKESPLLAQFVEEGKYPPVAERVGPEPVVVNPLDRPGTHGGTWRYLVTSDAMLQQLLPSRLSATSLVRWSPYGYPIVPHLAKSWEHNEDKTEWIFHLRRGVKWSDGHPWSGKDILFWYEHEVNDPEVWGRAGVYPEILTVRGEKGTLELIDDHTLKFTFPEPNGLFLEKMASWPGVEQMCRRPAHYLRRYHPTLGDMALVDEYMEAFNLPNRVEVYRNRSGNVIDPAVPRLDPWISFEHKSTGPYIFVRNPYYFMVDGEGRQLPYMDRLMLDVKSTQILPVALSNGEVVVQTSGARPEDYTLHMSQREVNGYQLFHWMQGDQVSFLIQPNQNRFVPPGDTQAGKKASLLRQKEFRQALSLAIDRKSIIAISYKGLSEPAQAAPPPESPFYYEKLRTAFIEHDPERAGRLLDAIGLDRFDDDGYRTLPDGSRLQLYLSVTGQIGGGPAQAVVDDLRKVGLRVSARERGLQHFLNEVMSRRFDLCVWSSNGEYMPLIEPRMLVPSNPYSFWARGYALWYQRGGLYGDERAKEKGSLEPAPDSAYRESMELYDSSTAKTDRAGQIESFRKVMDLAAKNLWTVGVASTPPSLVFVKDGVFNVPRQAIYSWDFMSPGNMGMETFSFTEPSDPPGMVAQTIDRIRDPVLPKKSPGRTDLDRMAAERTGKIARQAAFFLFLAGLIFIGYRHPYIGRRLLIMIPTLGIISVVSFTIIQAPPGDFLSTYIAKLEEEGGAVDEQKIEVLRERFNMDDSVFMKYLKWSGLYYFGTFEAEKKGLLQGHLGFSMATQGEVRGVVGDRILLTFFISLGTILFTWVTAVPIGIYSAVRQYSIGDYIVTFIGFIGMCIPNFLLAVLLMYVSGRYFGVNISGLFSPEYVGVPEWSWGKVMDLLKHIWVPVVVLGTGGTAGMIRVMRANLLDELRKPYVTTARAKGVRPFKLLMKYPVRLALNPFISGIGGIFPQLVSGGAIVAMVLSLPTVGPLMLEALLSEDMYMAGSMLMVLSALGVLGTLVSDLLLLALDPRIRMEGGSR